MARKKAGSSSDAKAEPARDPAEASSDESAKKEKDEKPRKSKSTSDDKKTNLGDAGTIKRLLDDAAISVRRPPTAHHPAPR